jgi:syntaxin 7
MKYEPLDLNETSQSLLAEHNSIAMSDYNRGGRSGVLLGRNAELGENLQNLTKRNSKLERMLAKIGTKADTPESRAKMTKERNEIKKLCKTLMVSLKQNQGGDKQVLDKLTNQFQAELEKFTKVSKAIEQREKEVVIAIEHNHEQEEYGGSPGLGAQGQLMEQDIDAHLLEYDVNELQRRQEGIQAIAQDVQEVSEMFKDLQLLVNEQQETLDVIENNILGTKDKTEDGYNELRQAEVNQKKARKKQCCMLFLVLGVVCAIVFGLTLTKS